MLDKKEITNPTSMELRWVEKGRGGGKRNGGGVLLHCQRIAILSICSIIDIFILPLAMDLKGHIADKIGLYRYSISTLYQITSMLSATEK